MLSAVNACTSAGKTVNVPSGCATRSAGKENEPRVTANVWREASSHPHSPCIVPCSATSSAERVT